MRLRDLALRHYLNLRSSTKSGLHSGTLTFYLTSSQKSRHALNNIIYSSGFQAVMHKQGTALACSGEALPQPVAEGCAISPVVLE